MFGKGHASFGWQRIFLAWVLGDLQVGEIAVTFNSDPWRLECGVSWAKFCYCFNFAVKAFGSLCHRLCGTVPGYLLKVLSFGLSTVSSQGARNTTKMNPFDDCLA